VNSVNRRDCPLLELTRNSFIRCKHEFFDQLVRFIIFNAFDFYRLTLFIEPNFRLWKIQIQRALLEAFLSQ
jgi:hypothetical protein